MSILIDRRLNDRNKNAVNRQRFLRRYKEQIRKSVADVVSRRSITDMDQGSDVSIPVRDISEPSFHHGAGGVSRRLPARRLATPNDRVFPPSDGSSPDQCPARV